MGEWLKTQNVSELTIAGVATDYCVKFTVLDALKEGFRVNLISQACRGVNLHTGDVEHALDEMQAAGALIQH
jgi:nicotinamidase/pyrazinamidase